MIQNYFTTAKTVTTLSVVVSNVLNPVPAVLTDEFVITIGVDVSDTGYGISAVQLESDNFTACSVTYTPTSVNRANSAMLISATPLNTIPSTGYIVITLPNQNAWSYDISSNTFPLSSSSLTCTNTTSVLLFS